MTVTETRSPIPLRCAPAIDDQRRLVARLQSQLAQADAIARTAAAQLAQIERLPQRLLAQAFAEQGDVP